MALATAQTRKESDRRTFLTRRSSQAYVLVQPSQDEARLFVDQAAVRNATGDAGERETPLLHALLPHCVGQLAGEGNSRLYLTAGVKYARTLEPMSMEVRPADAPRGVASTARGHHL